MSGIFAQNVPIIPRKITKLGAEPQDPRAVKCVKSVYSLKNLMNGIANPRYVKTAITPHLSLLLLISKGKVVGAKVLRERSFSILYEFKDFFSGNGDVRIPFDFLEISSTHKCYKVYLFLKKRIKFGSVITYGELGKILGIHPRFVGFCMKVNPFPVIIPCHRVISKKGLGGYSAGIDIKKELLNHEGFVF